ncbi:hypothetical protein [Caenispirillum salinarum]|uniref:hypothetical protein n=1 Tax=Caenispirillum salinarum TaxID=859058 RepID=UPI00384ECB35
MTASRTARAAAAFGLAVLAAAAAAAAPALAETAGPVSLFPGAGGGADAPSAAAPTAPDEPSVLADGAIAVQPLDRISLAAVGALDGAESGLPHDLWAGTPAPLAATLVTKLPVGAPSPVMHGLMTRLLAATAGAPEPAAGRAAGPDFLAARIEALRQLGAVDLALKLADAAPEAARTEAVRRARLDVMLTQVSADPEMPLPAPLCQAAREGLAAFDGPYWQKVTAVCDLATGREAPAQMAMAMLRETGHEDPAFFYLADRLSNVTPASLEALPAPEPLTLAMVRRAGDRLPEDALSSTAAPWLAAAVAAGGPGSAAERLAAAEQAAAAGALDAAGLADAYRAADFSVQEMQEPLGNGPATARERARLARLAALQETPALKAEALDAALAAAAGEPVEIATARLHADAIAALAPAPELAWFAPSAVRALLAAGRVEAAGPWIDALAQMRGGAAARDRALLAALVRVAVAPSDGTGPAVGRLLAEWRALRAAEAEDHGADLPLLDRRHTLLLGLLQAMGEPIGAGAWQPVLLDAIVDAAPAMPDAAILRALDGAAAEGRVGEVVALALIAIGPDGPDAVHPEALFRAVAALKAVGLERDARALALEALAAAGV